MHGILRLSFLLSLAAGFAAVAALTVVYPNWLERIWGLDPDGGNGAAEWLIVLASAVASALSARGAAMHLRVVREPVNAERR